jgi:hypothetical protein
MSDYMNPKDSVDADRILKAAVERERMNYRNSSTTPVKGEVHLHEQVRLADEQWRTIQEVRGLELWVCLLTIAVAAHILIDLF